MPNTKRSRNHFDQMWGYVNHVVFPSHWFHFCRRRLVLPLRAPSHERLNVLFDRPLHCYFSITRLTTKPSKLCVVGTFCWESIGNRKGFHVMAWSCWKQNFALYLHNLTVVSNEDPMLCLELILYWWRHELLQHTGIHFTNCFSIFISHFDGLMQERRNSSALAMKVRLPYTSPSTWCKYCIDMINIWVEQSYYLHISEWLYYCIVYKNVTKHSVIFPANWIFLRGISIAYENSFEMQVINDSY